MRYSPFNYAGQNSTKSVNSTLSNVTRVTMFGMSSGCQNRIPTVVCVVHPVLGIPVEFCSEKFIHASFLYLDIFICRARIVCCAQEKETVACTL